MLTITKLSKKYGNKFAVNSINYCFAKGLYGLLGTNGAGKTTTLKLISGLMNANYGNISYMGKNIYECREEYQRRIGYLPQHFGFIPDYTAKEFLYYMSSLKGIPKQRAVREIEYLLCLLDIVDECKKPMKALSGGNAQRVGIAQAMLGQPDILILDEPTVGLDPKERIKIRNIISAYSRNHTVIFSTHIVSDISHIAGDILIMNHGQIIRHGSEQQLEEEFDGSVWKLTVPEYIAEQIMNHYCVSNTFVNGDNIELRIVSDQIPIQGAIQVKPTLEDLYLYYCRKDEIKC